MVLSLEKYIRSNERLMRVLAFIYNIPFAIICSLKNIGRKSSVKYSGAFLRKVKISNHGKNNSIVIEQACRINHCCFNIYGDNNSIVIRNDCRITGLDIWCADGSNIMIGNHVHVAGNIHIASTEGKEITIGERCLLSSDIVIRNGDSHSLLTMDGRRINFAKDVIIGKHCWIGQNVTILKGTVVGNDCVIGTGSILTGGNNYIANSLIVGSPAKIVKSKINWCPNLI